MRLLYMPNVRMLLFLFSVFVLFIYGCTPFLNVIGSYPQEKLTKKINGLKEAGESCDSNGECLSQICTHYTIKRYDKECLSVNCTYGERTPEYDYYCNDDGMWKASKKSGESCEKDFECYEESCYMKPTCDLVKNESAFCENGMCVVKKVNDCPAGERKIVTREDCSPFVVPQRALRTVCAACGDGVCDLALENGCNCVEDCGS